MEVQKGRKINDYRYIAHENRSTLQIPPAWGSGWENFALSCLVPRPQYFAAVNRFGSRCPGGKVRPRQKPENGDNLSQFFTEPISSRGRILLAFLGVTGREKQFKLFAFVLTLIGQVKRLIWIETDLIESEPSALSNRRLILITHSITKFSKFRVQE